jgi:DNA-binding transcriptional regulator YhcF (GntR family)
MLIVVVDKNSEEPVYGQIARQIREMVADRRLQPGQSLPPVRLLASDLGINLNTVARAYRLLEDEGFIRIRDRSGAEVTAPAASPAPETRDRLLEEFRALLARLWQAGFPPAQLRQELELFEKQNDISRKEEI